MTRLAAPFVLVVLACAARSEPREHGTAALPAPNVPADAQSLAIDSAIDAPAIVPADAAESPTQPAPTIGRYASSPFQRAVRTCSSALATSAA
jgi:hypothetical protein